MIAPGRVTATIPPVPEIGGGGLEVFTVDHVPGFNEVLLWIS